jgi:branched-chain amino acid transport system ATP-binding protein
VLRVRDLCASYGGVRALHGVDVEVGEQEVAAVIGPNGAGKSTLLKAISGTVERDSGSIEFDGADITGLPAFERAQLGITHVPEGRHIFGSMSVRENLRLGAYRREAAPRFAERMELVAELFPALMPRLDDAGAALSGGQQQMLAIARGLLACPRVLLLDEPSMGLSPAAGDEIFAAIEHLLTLEKVAVILVEQRTQDVLELGRRVYVLDSGAVFLTGTPAELADDDGIARAYLGIEA